MLNAAVIQSNYIPWKGYFDIIHSVDAFVFYDDVQYTKNDWRNRNKIKTTQGAIWLTIPVGDNIDRLICDVLINDQAWAKKHWNSIQQAYSKAPYFKMYSSFFESVYCDNVWTNLSELNQYLIKTISKDFLGITTKFLDSRDYPLVGKKQDRLIDILNKIKATRYVSGPAARSYIELEKFKEMNIELVYHDYSNYPEYKQLFPPFQHNVSILDVLFNCGKDAQYFIWGWRSENKDKLINND